jgi:hypothetical protein
MIYNKRADLPEGYQDWVDFENENHTEAEFVNAEFVNAVKETEQTVDFDDVVKNITDLVEVNFPELSQKYPREERIRLFMIALWLALDKSDKYWYRW